MNQDVSPRISCFHRKIAIKDLPIQRVAKDLISGLSGDRKSTLVRCNEPGFPDDR